MVRKMEQIIRQAIDRESGAVIQNQSMATANCACSGNDALGVLRTAEANV